MLGPVHQLCLSRYGQDVLLTCPATPALLVPSACLSACPGVTWKRYWTTQCRTLFYKVPVCTQQVGGRTSPLGWMFPHT